MPGFYSPQGLDPNEARARTRILAIGAHPDDLEFMCLEPIARSLSHGSFGGLIVSSGSGSIRSPQHAQLSSADYSELRWSEQKEAARIGNYSFVDSLNLDSGPLRSPEGFEELVGKLKNYLLGFELDEIYLHQPFDRHPTHVRSCFAALEALRRLPQPKRPAHVFGCEVWRNIDWIPASKKTLRPLGQKELELQVRLAQVFESQADPMSAKNYVQALVGRKTANAVFQEGLTRDAGIAQEVYFDLNNWVKSELSWKELGDSLIEDFLNDACEHWPL
jgi:LmbE family N-acetylglucosaminyl deacetylase